MINSGRLATQAGLRRFGCPVAYRYAVRFPTLQKWQSELLAVASMAAFSIFLRERGSPESKPVGAPHDATGVSG